jgi:hypothetical protein
MPSLFYDFSISMLIIIVFTSHRIEFHYAVTRLRSFDFGPISVISLIESSHTSHNIAHSISLRTHIKRCRTYLLPLKMPLLSGLTLSSFALCQE